MIHLKGVDTQYGLGDIVFRPDTTIWAGTEEHIYHLNQHGELIRRYGKGPVGLNYLDVRDSLVVASARNNGQYYLVLFDTSGTTRALVKHHGHAARVFFSKPDGNIIAGSLHYTLLAEYLDKYCRGFKVFKAEYRRKFEELYQFQTAYTLSKFDLSLTLIDSGDFVDRHGESARAYNSLWSHDVFDLDTDGNLYMVHFAENYLIRCYSPDFTLRQEFRGEDPHFIPLPKTLTKTAVDSMNYTPGTYSQFYSLFCVGDYLVVGFITNRGSDRKGPVMVTDSLYYCDVYTRDGTRVFAGTTPARLKAHDGAGNLYVTITRPGEGRRRDRREFYLVQFPLDLLLTGGLTPDWVNRQMETFVMTGG